MTTWMKIIEVESMKRILY